MGTRKMCTFSNYLKSFLTIYVDLHIFHVSGQRKFNNNASWLHHCLHLWNRSKARNYSHEPTNVPPTRPRSARTSFPLMKSKVSSVRRCLLLAGVCRGPVLCRAVLFWEHDVTTHTALRHAAAASAARHVLSCTPLLLLTSTR